MKIELKVLNPEHLALFKKDMQEAFQQGAVDAFWETEELVLPEEDINRSLDTPGSIAYEAIADGQTVGGAIVVITPENKNHLDFLYVKNGFHGKGIGLQIWQKIEALHPETKVWQTATPYFEKRNIHFYVNKCGFHIVEFFNQWHKDPNDPDALPENEYFEGMFVFEKQMKG